MMQTTINILIVEDDPIIAQHIKACLQLVDYEVADVVYNKADALKALNNQIPDIALLDINLNGNMDGFEVAKLINEKYNIPFLYLTSYANRAVVEKAKHTHPMGYIVKPFDESDLYTSIEIALYNYAQMHQPRNFNRDQINKKIIANLTEKEFEILQDLIEGKTNQQMASKHFVSINTIKTHIKKVYVKLDVHSRVEVIQKLQRLLS